MAVRIYTKFHSYGNGAEINADKPARSHLTGNTVPGTSILQASRADSWYPGRCNYTFAGREQLVPGTRYRYLVPVPGTVETNLHLRACVLYTPTPALPSLILPCPPVPLSQLLRQVGDQLRRGQTSGGGGKQAAAARGGGGSCDGGSAAAGDQPHHSHHKAPTNTSPHSSRNKET
jgi:hypothetical protein